MTCIAGIVDREKGRVIIGADSASSNGYENFIRKDKKIFKKGDFIIGCTSSFRMIQLLQYSFNPPEIKKEIHEYMCTDFVNAVKKCFEAGGFIQKNKKGDDKGGFFLIGYKDHLFKIEDDFQVGENMDGVDACGSGQNFALGALYFLRRNHSFMSEEEKVKAALNAASHYSPSVSQPFHILTT